MTASSKLLVFALVGVSAAHAAEYVDRADADGDGFVSLHELRAAHFADPEFNKRIERQFQSYDRNGDGLISEEERRTLRGDNADRTGSGGSDIPTSAVATESAREIVSDTPWTATDARARINDLRLDDVGSAGGTRLGLDTTLTPGTGTAAPVAPVPDSRAGGTTGAEARRQAKSSDGPNSRTASWIAEIDADGSGGASAAELLANAEGQQWFSKREFAAADRNADGELDADELAGLVQSIERRQR